MLDSDVICKVKKAAPQLKAMLEEVMMDLLNCASNNDIDEVIFTSESL